jgi:uncharacterized protein YoxC
MSPTPSTPLPSQATTLHTIAVSLAHIEQQLALLTTQGHVIMADLTKLQADVAAQATVVESVHTLLTSLSAEIVALKGQVSNDPATQAAVDALAASVEQNSAALAAAVTANTDAPPAP